MVFNDLSNISKSWLLKKLDQDDDLTRFNACLYVNIDISF